MVEKAWGSKGHADVPAPGQGGNVAIDYPDWPNLPTMLFDRARIWRDRTLFRAFRDGAWRSLTWGEVARQAAGLAATLRAEGISPGDRVLIVSENRPEFAVAELAVMAIQAIPVPTYTTNTVADHAHILRDSGARVAIVSTPALAAKLREAGPPELLITMEASDGAGLSWAEAVAAEADLPLLMAEAAIIPPEALACLIYTSGTGGAPKGVMLPHRALLTNCRGARKLLAPLLGEGETYLSFLPLSHSYEHLVGLYFLPSVGTEVVFARGTEHLAADMLAVRPTVMTAVPRIFEVIRTRILAGVGRQPAWKQALFHRALAIGLKRVRGARRGPVDMAIDPVLERLVRRDVRARFGGRLKGIMSGGGRLDPDVGRFFLALGLPIMQGYGQTEAGPVISANPPFGIRIDTVGLPLDGVEVRIAEDGEICVRGGLVMHGYWNNPDATEAAIRDGWLHTGDVGVLDADGYLRITDRKKDFIKTSGGDMVSPARVEGVLMQQPEIAQAVVAGDGRAHLVALVVAQPDMDETAVTLGVDRANKMLSVTERVRRWRLVEPFTVENGGLTSTQKLRRAAILAQHVEAVAAMYRQG